MRQSTGLTGPYAYGPGYGTVPLASSWRGCAYPGGTSGTSRRVYPSVIPRGMSDSLTDQVAYEFGVFGSDSLGAGRADSLYFATAAVLQLPQLDGLVAFLKTDSDFVSGRYFFLLGV